MSVEAADIGGTGQAGSGFPVVVLAAAVLAAERVSGVLVGSAALRLRGEPVSVGDVDVVIEPGEANLQRLHEALVLIDLAQPWKLPVPLVERRGNFGSRGNDPPASPRYTEARLSPAGQVALAAERGEIAPVPIGMINGNTHREGVRPPFRPAALMDAIRQVLLRPGCPRRGSPASPARLISSPAAP
ncbi:MAG TPA: DNA gyrase subunit A [Streptosporangiaceae bacterium]|nr:DNA gyrase subunit A [Streptosporangiaceae bacterium]